MSIDRFEKFSNSIFKLFKIWHKIAAHEMSSFGLNASQLTYILSLYNSQNGMTSADLVYVSGKDKSDVSRSLNALVKEGLVEKQSIHQKGYGGIFFLTDEGKDIAGQLNDKVNKAVDLANLNITEEKREVFYEVLENFLENLETIEKEGLA